MKHNVPLERAMIENERQKHQAQRQIEYWKSQLTGGSWMGLEGARREIRKLQDQIDVYDRRTAEPGSDMA